MATPFKLFPRGEALFLAENRRREFRAFILVWGHLKEWSRDFRPGCGSGVSRAYRFFPLVCLNKRDTACKQQEKSCILSSFIFSSVWFCFFFLLSRPRRPAAALGLKGADDAKVEREVFIV